MRNPGDSAVRAIVEQLKEARRKRLYEAYAEAFADPEYLAQMREIDKDFEIVLNDGEETMDDECRLST